MSEALSGRELDRALAEAMGWVLCRSSAQNAKAGEVFLLAPETANERNSVGRLYWPPATEETTFDDSTLPAFSESVDALAPVEAKLRAAGCTLASVRESPPDEPSSHFEASWRVPREGKAIPHYIFGESTTSESEARARAALAALKALVVQVKVGEEA